MQLLNVSERYTRQVVLEGFGTECQEKLNKSRVLVAGVGGLGTPAALYLAACGVGTIGLLDDDVICIHNLNRQILYWSDDVSHTKVEAAASKLQRFNTEITVKPLCQRLNADNAAQICSDFDIILDCMDQMESKFLLNYTCVHLNKPFVLGGAMRFFGQLTTIIPGVSPCLTCYLPALTECVTCEREGTLGPVVGTIGVLQALEAVKFITGIGDLLVGRLMLFDGLRASFSEIPIEKRPDCPVCGDPHMTTSDSANSAELIDYLTDKRVLK